MSSGERRLRSAMRRLPWNRFFAGVVSGAAALAVTLLLRVIGLGLFLPEVAFESVITHVPGAIESAFIGVLGEGAKGLGFVTALVVTLIAFGIGAVFYRRVERLVHRRWGVVAVYTALCAILILLVVLPLLGAGLLGSAADAGVLGAVLSQVLGAGVYASSLDYFLVEVASRHPEGFSPSRRQFLVGAAATLAALGLAFETFSSTVVQPARLAFASLADLLANEVTPTDSFYVVTKNLIDPVVDVSTWKLTVDMMVSNPLSMGYSDLQTAMQSGTLPPVEEYATMECVSNEVGGNLIGTAKWRGVRLADLLQYAGIDAVADWVAFESADGYTAAIPRAQAMDPATLLVLEMNGAPLEGRHGAPARILVPGKYGMFSAKWLTRISALLGPFLGFWQDKGWTNDGRIHTGAIIATPPAEAVVTRPVTIGGVALSAAKGISRVEVSTDGGITWVDAQLRIPKDPRLTWIVWTLAWNPSAGGAYRIVARAYDGDGVLQEASVAPPFPDGASGYDRITLYVSA